MDWYWCWWEEWEGRKARCAGRDIAQDWVLLLGRSVHKLRIRGGWKTSTPGEGEENWEGKDVAEAREAVVEIETDIESEGRRGENLYHW